MSAHKKFEFDGVCVTLIAGLAERIQNEWSAERAGWYVLCNGRVVVTADKTELTGWGKQYATFVGKYRGFLGIAIFVSKKPEAPDERDIAEGVKATDIQKILSGQQSNFVVKPTALRSKKMTVSVQYLAK